MQKKSYLENINPRLHIYPSENADEHKRKLLSVGPNFGSLEVIGRSLLTELSIESMVPVFVLRGGLALWETCKQVIGNGPVGMVVPTRDRHESVPKIAYASLPIVPNAQYAFLDVIVASGRTMSACLAVAQERIPNRKFHVVAPFVATVGRDLLLAEHSSVQVHCIWHAEKIDSRGRMVGPGFDVGDHVVGWTKNDLFLGDNWKIHA